MKRRDNRPLLHGRDPLTVLSDLAQVRDPIYALAPVHIVSNATPHESTVNAILKALRS